MRTLILFFAATLLLGFHSESAVATEGLRVATFSVDITPPLGAPMAGYYHERGADGVLDPLYSKADAAVDTAGKDEAESVAELRRVIAASGNGVDRSAK